jgi:hypothetical protein
MKEVAYAADRRKLWIQATCTGNTIKDSTEQFLLMQAGTNMKQNIK